MIQMVILIFLYDLVTPPAVNRQPIQTQINPPNNLFTTDWNGRILLPNPTISNETDNVRHEQQNILR